MIDSVTNGLIQASEILYASHLTKLAKDATNKGLTDDPDVDPAASLVKEPKDIPFSGPYGAQLFKAISKQPSKEERKGSQYTSVFTPASAQEMNIKTAGPNLTALGAGAGALGGGLHEIGRLLNLAKDVKAAKGVTSLHRAAEKKLLANPKYVKSFAERQAGRDVEFLKQHKALGGQSFRDNPMGHISAFLPHVGRSAASWGAAGGVGGAALHAGLGKYRQHQILSTVKKWALPTAAGVVGYKVLTD